MIFLRLFFGFLLQVLPFSVLSLQPFEKHMRYSKKVTGRLTLAIIFFLAASFAGTGVYLKRLLPPNQMLFNAVNLVFLLMLLPCLVWYLYVIKAAWQKKLFIFSFALSSALAITAICNAISTYIPLSGQTDGLPYRSWSLLILFGLTAITLPLLFLLLVRCYKPVEDGLNATENVWLSVLSLIQFLILTSGLSFISYDNLYNPMSLFLFAALFIMIFVIYVIFFKMLFLSHEKMKAQQEADEIRYLLSLQAEQYRHIRENIDGSRRIRHDLQHHMITLQGFLQNNDIEAAEVYIANCMEHASRFETIQFCSSQIINTMLGYYRTQAEDNDVALTVRISIPDKITILDEDLAVMLGNLLQNAIDATIEVEPPNRFIQFNIAYSGKMLAITVDNGFTGIVRMDGESYLSTKLQHDGIGLQSVAYIAGKYNGGVEFTHDGSTFHSSVMLGME